MSTRDIMTSSISDTISPAPSMSNNPAQYHRLSNKIEDYDEDEQHFETAATSGHVQVIANKNDVVEDHIIDIHNNSNETDSLVDGEMMLPPRPGGSTRGGSIFRTAGVGVSPSHNRGGGAATPGSWTPSSLGSGGGGGGGPGGIVEVLGGGGGGNVNAMSSNSRTSSRTNSPLPLHHLHSPLSTTDDIDGGAGVAATVSSSSNAAHKNKTFGLSTSRSSSVEWEDYDDDDFDDDDDADAVVRRYHHIVAVSKVPSLPAEFSHERSIPKRIWQSFLELRAAARQRRAARLLTLPSDESCSYDLLQACFMTWCCDATDRGIALVAVLLFLWLVIGMTAGTMVSSTYWWMGILLFTMRVSARRCYDMLIRKRHYGRTHRLSSTDSSMEMSNASSTKKARNEPKTYRDESSSEPGNII